MDKNDLIIKFNVLGSETPHIFDFRIIDLNDQLIFLIFFLILPFVIGLPITNQSLPFLYACLGVKTLF